MSGVMRTQAERHQHPGTAAAADLGRRGAAALAALGQAAHAALPVPGRGRRRVPPQRSADHAPPGARLPGRPERDRGGGRLPLRPRPARRAGARPRSAGSARCTCRAATGWTCGARPATARATAASSSAARSVLAGGRTVTVPAPLDELPLLARAGALLSLLPADVDTLASYGDAAPAVSLAERAGERVLLAFPRGRSSARLEHGGELRSEERRGRWELAIRSERRGPLGAPGVARAPCAGRSRPARVRLDGRRLPASAWSYDSGTGVLSARFATRPRRARRRAAAGASRSPASALRAQQHTHVGPPGGVLVVKPAKDSHTEEEPHVRRPASSPLTPLTGSSGSAPGRSSSP